MKLQLVTAPTVEPLTTDDVKAQSRIDISDDDSLIGAYIEVARAYVETILSTALITQTWDYTLEAWPGKGVIYLPRPPLQSVTSITYTDKDGNSDTVSSADYLVDTAARPGRIVLKGTASWPAVTLRESNAIVVRFVAGYGDAASDVPPAIRQALKLLVGDFYENRENTLAVQGLTLGQMPVGLQALLGNYNMRHERVIAQG